MIGIKLSGGLGNNMFEYAAAKSLAKKNNYKLCYLTQKDYKFYLKKFKKHLIYLAFGKKEKFQKQLSNKDLSRYFNIEEKSFKLYLRRFLWVFAKKNKEILIYQNSVTSSSNRLNLEIFVDKFYKSQDWTELKGGFFSEKFFISRDYIIDCFKLKKFYEIKLIKLEKCFYFPPEKRCCIHIRRGDSLYMDKGFDYKGFGWSLPEYYYKFLIDKLGLDLLYIFVSDDPDWVETKFMNLPNKMILRNNPEIIDMFVFTKCKYNIISRSTFSWWGAWLNQIHNKEVYAPKYFIGINQKKCYPVGMDQGNEVRKWHYIDVDMTST